VSFSSTRVASPLIEAEVSGPVPRLAQSEAFCLPRQWIQNEARWAHYAFCNVRESH
jgi:hypothetical protein